MSFYTWEGYDLAADDDTEEYVSIECYESLAYELDRVCTFLTRWGVPHERLEDIINGTEAQGDAVWYSMYYR